MTFLKIYHRYSVLRQIWDSLSGKPPSVNLTQADPTFIEPQHILEKQKQIIFQEMYP